MGAGAESSVIGESEKVGTGVDSVRAGGVSAESSDGSGAVEGDE